MTSTELSSKYTLLKCVSQSDARSYNALQSATDQVVLVHFLDHENAAEHDALLSLVHRLSPQDAAKVVEIAEVDNATVVVTHFLEGFVSLGAWLAPRAGPERGTTGEMAVPPAVTAPPQAPTPASSAQATPPASPSAAAPGEFTRMFQSGSLGASAPPEGAPPGRAAAAPPPVMQAAPAPPPPARAGASFTELFAPPPRPVNPTGPIATSPPPAPTSSLGENTGLTPAAPAAPDTGSAKPSSAQPGSFTQMFGASSVVSSPTGASPAPARGAPTPASPLTPPAHVPARERPTPPVQAPAAGSAAATGRAAVTAPLSAPTPPAAQSSPPPVAAPGEFTRLFRAGPAPSSTESGLAASSASASQLPSLDELARRLAADAPLAPAASRPGPRAPTAGNAPVITQPNASTRPSDDLMELEILPPLGDPLTTPSAPPAPPVPSEYTRIISTPVRPSTVGAAGGGSATQPAPAPAPAAPKLEVPKVAAPGELPAPRKPSYLPLILLLNGVVLAAIALVVYFLLAR